MYELLRFIDSMKFVSRIRLWQRGLHYYHSCICGGLGLVQDALMHGFLYKKSEFYSKMRSSAKKWQW